MATPVNKFYKGENAMNPIKMLCLAALAALMATAFAGASSAVAEPTALCSNDVKEECTEITHVHETSIGQAVLESELMTIECNALFLGDTVEGSAAPLIIKGTYTYSSCSDSCTVKEENGPAEIKILRTGTELGTVTGKGLLHITCPFINCSYSGKGLEGHALGGLSAANEKGEISFVEQKATKEAGALCPSEVFLSIKTEPLGEFFIDYWKMVCIFIGANQGHYLSVNPNNNKECTTPGHTTRIGSYELAVARTDVANKMVCAIVGPNNGLYLVRRWWPWGKECDGLDKNILNEVLRVGEYELGTTS
jgi:hypothetical protein